MIYLQLWKSLIAAFLMTTGFLVGCGLSDNGEGCFHDYGVEEGYEWISPLKSDSTQTGSASISRSLFPNGLPPLECSQLKQKQ